VFVPFVFVVNTFPFVLCPISFYLRDCCGVSSGASLGVGFGDGLFVDF